MASIGNALLAEIIKPKIQAVVQKYMSRPLNAEMIADLSRDLDAISTHKYKINVRIDGDGDLRIDLIFIEPSGDADDPDR